MVGFISRRPRRLDTLVSSSITGILVHAVAGMVFAALVVLKIEGCDIHDGRAGALAAAIAIDVLVTGPVLWIVLRVNRHDRIAVLTGWALSLVPALALFVAAAVHLNSLPTGCPV